MGWRRLSAWSRSLFREALLFGAARVRLVGHRHPAYSGRPNTSSRSMRPRTVWKPRGTRGRGQARAKARETRIGRNSCFGEILEIGANLADLLAGTERESGGLKDSGSHLLVDIQPKGVGSRGRLSQQASNRPCPMNLPSTIPPGQAKTPPPVWVTNWFNMSNFASLSKILMKPVRRSRW